VLLGRVAGRYPLGASFPLALASVASPGQDRAVGRGVYAANTLGAIFGSLFASLLLVGLDGASTRSSS